MIQHVHVVLLLEVQMGVMDEMARLAHQDRPAGMEGMDLRAQVQVNKENLVFLVPRAPLAPLDKQGLLELPMSTVSMRQ